MGYLIDRVVDRPIKIWEKQSTFRWMAFHGPTESSFGIKAIMDAVSPKHRLTGGIVSVLTAAGIRGIKFVVEFRGHPWMSMPFHARLSTPFVETPKLT
jgi:hypothetical protein